MIDLQYITKLVTLQQGMQEGGLSSELRFKKTKRVNN